MNSHAIRYRTYKMLLEVDLTPHQRDELMLNEDLKGIISGIANFLKGGADAIKRMGAGVAQAFEDPKTAKELETTKDTVKDLLQKLKALAPKGVDQKAFVANILNAYLNSFGVKPEELANPKPVGAAEGGKEAEQGLPGGVPPGDPVELGTPETAVTAAASAAEVAGQNVEKAVEKAKDMKTSDVLVAWSKTISEKTGVQEKIVAIFLSKILDLKLLYGIGESHEIFKDILNEAIIFYRWQKLAGVAQLTEIYNDQKVIFEADSENVTPSIYADPDLMKSIEFRNKKEKEEAEKASKLPKDFETIYKAILAVHEKDRKNNNTRPDLDGYYKELLKVNPASTAAMLHALTTVGAEDFRKMSNADSKAKIKSAWEEKMDFFENPPPGVVSSITGNKDAMKSFSLRAELTKLRTNVENSISALAEKEKADKKKIAPRLKKLFSNEYEQALKIDPDFSDDQLYSIFKTFDNLKYARLKIAVV